VAVAQTPIPRGRVPRWTPENRPSIDTSKRATTDLVTETLTPARTVWFLVGMSNVLDHEKQQQIRSGD
jgi:hypothetical protein